MIKKIITFILNFILVILCIIAFMVILISNTALNNEYLKSMLKENNFYERSYSDIKDGFVSYTMQSGLELEILDNLVSNKKVESDINARLDAILNNKEAKIDTTFLKAELDYRINTALENNNRIPTENEKISIEKYENAIEECYDNGILYGNYSKKLHIPSDLVSKYFKYIIFAIIVDAVLIIIINRKLKTIFNSLGVILLPAGVLILSIKPLIEHKVQNILIFDQKFSNFLVYVLNDIINKCFKFGIIFAIIGFIFILISSLKKFEKTIEDKIN